MVYRGTRGRVSFFIDFYIRPGTDGVGPSLWVGKTGTGNKVPGGLRLFRPSTPPNHREFGKTHLLVSTRVPCLLNLCDPIGGRGSRGQTTPDPGPDGKWR